MSVSVVMATYNGADYIEEQLDTICNQTRPADELIVCDDGSTDNTVEIVREYISRHGLDEKWHVYVNPDNLGFANNFNHAASLATCDLILFSDQDDRWDPEKIAVMEKIMQEHEDCSVLCSDYLPWAPGDPKFKAPKNIRDKMPDNGILEKVKLGNRSLYIGAIGCCTDGLRMTVCGGLHNVRTGCISFIPISYGTGSMPTILQHSEIIITG